MCEFLKSNCPALLTEDVLHSNSFITGMRPFLDEYFIFKKVHEEYLKTKTHVNTRKTELSKSLRRIDDSLNVLKENLISAGEIKLALKLSNLATVVSHGNELASVIKTSQVVQKMKKRIQQCTSSDEKVLKEINKYKTNLRCFNSSLTLEKSFHDLENSNKSNIPLDIVTRYASLVKENLFCNIDTFHELSDPIKRRLQDFLVLKFPILELTRDSQTILINVHEIILDSNLFEILLTFNEPPRPTEESFTVTKNSTQNSIKKKQSSVQQTS